MTELRWVLTREQVSGTFSEPLDLADGSGAFARLQYRESGFLAGPWKDIPVVSDIGGAPKLELVVPGSRH